MKQLLLRHIPVCLALFALASCSMHDELDLLEPESRADAQFDTTLSSPFSCTPAPDGPHDNTLRMGMEYTFRPAVIKADLMKCDLHYDIYQVDGPKGDYETVQNNGSVTVTFYKPGMYRVMCTPVERSTGKIRASFSFPYEVPAMEPWIEGPDTVSLHGIYEFRFTCWNPYLIAPKYSVQINETFYKDAHYSIIEKTNDILRIRFNQPGTYEIKVNIDNYPDLRTGTGTVEVYPRYFHKLETRQIDRKDGLCEYSNRLYFYEDEALTRPLTVPEKTIMLYQIKYGLETSVKPFYIDPNKIKSVVKIPTGSRYVDLPNTKDTRQTLGQFSLVMKPRFEFSYPDSKFEAYNPYRAKIHLM